MSTAYFPKFVRELFRFSATHPQFVLFGNVHDVFPLPQEGRYIPLPFSKYLAEALQKHAGYDLVVEYLPLQGFEILNGERELFKTLTDRSPDSSVPLLEEAAEVLTRLSESPEKAVAVLLSFSSRLPELRCREEFPDFLYRLFRLGQKANPVKKGADLLYNLLIFVFDKEEDLPRWYTLENARIRSAPVPRPDPEMRRLMAETLVGRMPDWDKISDSQKEEIKQVFVDLTGGMLAREMVAITQLARKEKLSVVEIGEAIRRYKVGIQDNPWAKINPKKLREAEAILMRRVIGQPQAVRATAQILRRSFFNLSGAQFSRYSHRPKGVLFFAGPTGVGKTELAKAITEFLFGSEHNYIRFDMSEFSQEHADQRLLGAPPGYVGYEGGGELTNAIRQRPFAVVLFDEIEKAHPKIMDIFLQLLDDGRLTSGRGETVYFSETLIVFTSNLGVYEMTPDGRKIQRVTPDLPYEKIQEKLLEAIQDHFKYKLGRPEILNRIGENIVVFDFIRPQHAEKILQKMLRNICLKLEDERRISLQIAPYVEKRLLEEVSRDLSMGGRGIGNKLEKLFINPLAELLFELSPSEGQTVHIKDITKSEGEWRLHGSL
jgi:ATP-dependent Clp protease ATP-binding subunit ClpA